MVNNSLSFTCIDFFKNTFDYSIHDILLKYTTLLNEYTKFIFENFTNKNKLYSKFIMIRGLDTITNVFNHVLLYTKNLDISYFYSQKAYYFYVEFIEQITNDNNAFLKLSSRDASLYVYKKTIFEINTEYKKKPEFIFYHEEKQKHFLLNNFIQLSKILFSKFIDFYNDYLFNPKNENKKIFQDLEKIGKYIINTDFSEKELDLLPLYLNKFENKHKHEKDKNFFKSILSIIKEIKENNPIKN
jgi:hypothetical protein